MPLARKLHKKYTYSDYLQWPEDTRAEIIHGVIFDMTPAPSRRHQEVSGELYGQLWNYFRERPCRVYAAPFDVRLPDKNEDGDNAGTVVQPDIVVVCDEKKLDDRGARGAPDIVIEIVSPESARRDMKQKLELYEHHGVKEYWVVHPDTRLVMVFRAGKGKKYARPDVYGPEDTIETPLFNGLSIDCGRVFGVVGG